MNLFRLLLLPFSLLYGLVVVLRNIAYDKGIFTSHKFKIPVISVGNMVAGGAGKSPITEYIIWLLKDRYKVATLSRGYGRKTTGFIELNRTSTTEETGDEPVQFKRKFPSVTVAVCEDRVTGIEHLQSRSDLIILDDAYQHRAVNPGLSLLLFDYNSIFKMQYLLPAGNLREPLSGRKRADIIIISKTPTLISETERTKVIEHIDPFSHQKVFFSYLEYGDLISLNEEKRLPLSELNEETGILLLSGIANPDPLINELKPHTLSLIHHHYPDHHQFSTKNIAKLVTSWSDLKSSSRYIITTEKDAQRLRSPELKELLSGLPVYYLPVKAKIHEPGDQELNHIIEQYVAKHLYHNGIH